MKLLPEHTLTVPWYRSRLFWGIILLLQFFLNIMLLKAFGSYDTIGNSLISLLTASGSGIFWVILATLFNNFEWTNLLSNLLYVVFLPTLLVLTFRKKHIQLVFPIILLVSMLITLITGILLLGSYS